MDYSINEVCLHGIVEVKVLHAECGCETVVEVCIECGNQSEPKTEC